jgi:hypothetical protein
MKKIQTFLFVLLITLAFASCKNKKSIDSLELVTPVLVDNNFKVTLNVIVKKDDTFSLFYTIDGSTDFSNIAPIWKAIKGEQNEQSLKYTLPENVYPTQLRFDFGLEKEQEDIILRSVILEYKDKKKEINGPQLVYFFRADDSKCVFDASTGLIKALIKNGIKENPSLYPQEVNLGPELKNLVN